MKKDKIRTNEGDGIAGDHIYVTCQKPGKWNMIKKSRQHRGWGYNAKKDAKAVR
ncbi:MAG: hypothetical protein JRC66_09570 [Deltaproteobacteria bacterium]|nr:hypothetical protein [Deltaproteobacteria bacterium]